jgi:hypothetical protein
MEGLPNPESEKEEKTLTQKVRSAANKVAVVGGMILGGSGVASAQNHGEHGPHKNREAYPTEKMYASKDATPEDIAKARAFYEKQRAWLIDVVTSPEYKRRLLEQEGMTEKDLEDRIATIKKIPLDIQTAMKPYIDDKGNIIAFYNSDTKKVELPPTGFDDIDKMVKNIAFHELEHGITDGDEKMSDYAESLYKKAFSYSGDDNDFINEILSKLPGITFNNEKHLFELAATAPQKSKDAYDRYKWMQYLKNPSELDARKKVFEHELEEKGIKKYDEKFTPELFNKIISPEIFNSLSPNSQEFLNHVNETYIYQIMNTVAETNPEKTVHWNDIVSEA